ncbi:MAG: hypothetical protein CR991_05025 [Proteobacteria bacterium]|nr:MAG: hypothetical protein CR991_05025 [Pseudomonadota bacterium]
MAAVTGFDLPVVRFQWIYQADTAVRLPAYAGSAWRGAFGSALRRSVCVTRESDCNACLLQRSCVYSQVFETPAGQGPLLAKVNKAPHPYVLHPLETSGSYYQPGDTLTVRMTLLGQTITQLPYMVHAMQQAGLRGVGKAHGRLSLLRVEQERCLGNGEWQTIYESGGLLAALDYQAPVLPEPPALVRVCLHTPYRAMQQGRLVGLRQFGFQGFVMGLLRRLSLLSVHHGGSMQSLDFRALQQAAGEVALINPDLRWYDWVRYSSRQQEKVPMGGLVGQFGLAAAAMDVFWPWLWWGQWLHVGKGAVMGMGEYSIETLENS